MKKCILLILLLSFHGIKSQTAGQGVTDADGNKYKTVVIGNQEWMSENLKTTKYCNGDILPINNNNSTVNWGKLTVGAWKFHSDYPNNGYFYNWYAASDSRNVCPCNWHVSSDSEWTILENYLIANGFNYDGTTTGNKIAKAMASTASKEEGFWESSSNTGAVGNNFLLNNSSGFNALPLGMEPYTWAQGYFAGRAFWWTSNEWKTDNTYALWRSLSYQYNNLESGAPDIGVKGVGFSIRCVKNSPLSIETHSKFSFNVYPNPTNDYINIQLSFLNEPTQYKISDTSGKIILTGDINNKYFSLDLTELQSGIYYISLKNNAVNETKILIKQ
jgi:uncharacterized protein (TIGR02145 family)